LLEPRRFQLRSSDQLPCDSGEQIDDLDTRVGPRVDLPEVEESASSRMPGVNRAIKHAGPEAALGGEVGGIENHDPMGDLHGFPSGSQLQSVIRSGRDRETLWPQPAA
jgi:hypothetical protein